MKRKLIAIALACAMVFSMIPSLAFADVAESSVAGVPSGTAINDMFIEVGEYDYKGLTLDNYKALNEKLVAAIDAYDLLDEIDSDAAGDYNGDYSEAQEKAAATELKKVIAGNETAAITAYDNGLKALLEKEIAALVDAYDADFPAKAAAVSAVGAKVPALVDAYMAFITDSPSVSNLAKLTEYENVLFEIRVDKEFSTYMLPDATPAQINPTVKANAILSVKEAVDMYPQLPATKYTGDYVQLYDAVVALYNAKFMEAFSDASNMLTAYMSNVEKYDAQIVQELAAARNAYDSIIADDYTELVTSTTRVNVLEDLHALEAGYVEELIAVAGTTVNDTNAADVIPAIEKARVAYDKLVEFYDESGEDEFLAEALGTHTCVAIGTLPTAEKAITTYYQGKVNAAFLKVQNAETVTDENKADVEAFIAAYDAYVAKLSEGEIANPSSALQKYTAKYEVLKPALEEVVKAEEQAKADEAAKIAILSTKVKNVKAVAGKKKATIKWAKNDAADGYKVMRATSKNGKFKAVKKNTTKVKFVNKKLKSGKTYYYKVVAYKTIAGKKVWSKDSKIVKVKVK